LVEQAQSRSAASHIPLASCEIGDARNLRFPDSCAQFVLLLGPLYHLTTPTERLAAIKEAARVLKPRGRLFAAAISRWASALDGLARDLFQDPRFTEIADGDLRDGQHRNPTERLDFFTTAYFHRPEELRSEVAEAGLQVLGLYGVEGPGWILADIDARMSHSRQRADLLRVARSLESESSVLGINAHLLLVAEKG
jgi:SAM-dependent methyltransferase